MPTMLETLVVTVAALAVLVFVSLAMAWRSRSELRLAAKVQWLAATLAEVQGRRIDALEREVAKLKSQQQLKGRPPC